MSQVDAGSANYDHFAQKRHRHFYDNWKMNAFDSALKHTLGIEGDFSDDPADSGGATKWGITESVARAFGYSGPMQDMPVSLAQSIYLQNYWELLKLNVISMLSEDIALEIFDTGVNCGVGFAGQSLQRALTAFNRNGRDYPDLVVDGLVGRMTHTALRAFLDKRGLDGEMVLLRALNCLQGARYIQLVENRPKDERFIYGWFLNRVK